MVSVGDGGVETPYRRVLRVWPGGDTVQGLTLVQLAARRERFLKDILDVLGGLSDKNGTLS
jgi:hypothetical protein